VDGFRDLFLKIGFLHSAVGWRPRSSVVCD
jgi:hypothetical protein